MAEPRVTTRRVAIDPTRRVDVRWAEAPRSTSRVADLVRTIVDANITVGQAGLAAVGEVADNLISSASGVVANVEERAAVVAPQPSLTSADIRRVQVAVSGRGGDVVERPTVRVADTAARSKFFVDLPGVAAEDIVVEATPRTIEVSAYRPVEESGAGIRYDASIALDRPLDPRDVAATYSDGVLTVEVGSSTAAARRRVEVSAGGGPREDAHDHDPAGARTDSPNG